MSIAAPKHAESADLAPPSDHDMSGPPPTRAIDAEGAAHLVNGDRATQGLDVAPVTTTDQELIRSQNLSAVETPELLITPAQRATWMHFQCRRPSEKSRSKMRQDQTSPPQWTRHKLLQNPRMPVILPAGNGRLRSRLSSPKAIHNTMLRCRVPRRMRVNNPSMQRDPIIRSRGLSAKRASSRLTLRVAVSNVGSLHHERIAQPQALTPLPTRSTTHIDTAADRATPLGMKSNITSMGKRRRMNLPDAGDAACAAKAGV